MAAPTPFKAEAAEADGRITLGQMRKLAEGLDCEVVYALVPRRPLGEIVEAQADKNIGCDWGERNLVATGTAQQSYIAAQRAAYAGDMQPLMVFVRS